MMRCLIIVSIIVVILEACSSTKEHRKFKYAKSNFILKQPTLLRTDGVYLNVDTIKGIPYYFYMRFYENGRCYVSDLTKGKPTEDSLRITNSPKGTRTYYTVKGNDLQYEAWGGYYTGYVFVLVRIDSSKLYTVGIKPRGF